MMKKMQLFQTTGKKEYSNGNENKGHYNDIITTARSVHSFRASVVCVQYSQDTIFIFTYFAI